MKSIAILYICTGKYSVLWKEFYESFEERFLPSQRKEYFVFTDAQSIEYQNVSSNIHLVHQEALEWPYGTLLRFHMFNKIKEELSSFDYVFFFNANSFLVKTITEDMILPRKELGEDICVVKHSFYRNKKPYEFPYDRNYKCKAFIPYWRGKLYVQGSLIGGTADGFLKMSQVISNQTDSDLANGIIAKWHDESYLNKYILKRKDYRLLDVSYAYQRMDNAESAIIWLRPKSLYFDIDRFKSNPNSSNLSVFNDKLNTLIEKYLSRRDDIKSDYKTLKIEKGLFYAFIWRIKHLV